MREEGKSGKIAENADEAGGDGSERCRFRNEHRRPGIEKSAQWSVSIANINVLAAGLRFHRAQFCVGESAKEGKQSADEPCEINESRRADRLHHLRGNEKNATADDRAHHNRGGMTHAERAWKVRCGVANPAMNWSRSVHRKSSQYTESSPLDANLDAES